MPTKKYDFSLGYPKRDGFKPGYGERLKYIKYPLRVANKRWIAAEIVPLPINEGGYIHQPLGLVSASRYVSFNKRDECLAGCTIHNDFEFGEGNWEHIVAQAFAG